MIVRADEAGLLLVRQADHAVLAGRFAESWGNETFARPEPFESVCRAAARHDDGWIAWDDRPKINPDTRLPYQFAHVPVDEHFALYERGIRQVVQDDPYAGLLVSRHCLWLYQLKLAGGSTLRLSEPGRDPRLALREYVGRLKAQQRELFDGLAATDRAARRREQSRVHANSRLLQFFDTLSLYFCTAPAAECSLGPVPVNYDGDEAAIALRPLDERTVAASPYPFRDSSVPVRVPATRIAHRPYDSDAHLQHAFGHGRKTELAFELRRG